MSKLAAYLARILWGLALWLMRRPWMKRLQQGAERLIPESRRPRARQSLLRQNRFARRYGLPIMTFSLNVLLASIILTACFQAALQLFDSGVLTLPDHIRERAASP